MKICIGKFKKYSYASPRQSPRRFTAFMVKENKKWAEIICLTDITLE
jgi:hypothetical protein